MALYGTGGDAAYVASARAQAQHQASAAWLGWVVVVPLLAVGALAASPALLAIGLLGLGALSVWAVQHQRRRRQWMRMSAALARQTGRPIR